MKKIHLKTLLLILMSLVPLLVSADDEAARRLAARAAEEFKDGYYKDAGDHYLEAEEAATDTVLKANSLKEAIQSFRMGGLLYKEFNAIDRLTDRYASYTDVVSMLDRMYDIGDSYFAGKREPAFWALRWIPWLHDRDKTAELYTRALAKGPYAEKAHQARMRLAVSLIADGKSQEALGHLREIVRQERDKEDTAFAYLILGEQLFLLSQKGDGDGKYNQEALEVLTAFQKKYPTAPENDMVEKWLLKSKDIQAKRLLSLADFYAKSGKHLAAQRYLSTILTRYPDSTSAEDAERQLVELDKTYIPGTFAPELKSRIQSYDSFAIPAEPKELITLPAESNGKFLLPVYDLKLGRESAPGTNGEQK